MVVHTSLGPILWCVSYSFFLIYLSLSVVFCCLSDCQNNISNYIIDDGFVVLPLLSISGRKCKKMAVHHTNIMEHNAASYNHTISWHSVLLLVTHSPNTDQCWPIVSHTHRKWIQSCWSVFHRFMSKGESNQIDLVWTELNFRCNILCFMPCWIFSSFHWYITDNLVTT